MKNHSLVSTVRSLATILGCLVVWLALQATHQSLQQPKSSVVEEERQQTSRALKMENEGTPTLDDDISRDKVCRDYIKQFLNGTTDAKDQCAGMYNAFIAGDCKDLQGINNLREDENMAQNSTTLIDDYFEAWDCCYHISSYYSKQCEQEQLDATRLFGIVAVLIVCWLAKSLLRVNSGWQWIPDAGACILVGAVVGGLLRFVVSSDVINKHMIFNNNLFLQILLPPIIFEAALSIDKRAFRRDLFPILTFAVLGTGFSAVVIGYITYHMSALGSSGSLPFLESLTFGALMSSIDPVATLSILSGVGVGQGDTLYTLVFGESLLNDGVSIVLFDSLVRHIGDADVVGEADVAEVLWHFFLVSFGSVVVGLICGALCTYYFWAMQGQNTAVSEGALFFTWALIPYYIADAFEFSGIISIMVMGFMLDYYVVGGNQDERAEWSSNLTDMDHVSPPPPPPSFRQRFKRNCEQAFSGKGHMQEHARDHVGYVAEVISSIVETAIFAYLGLFLFNDNNGNFKLTAAGVFACVSSRAVMVVLLCALINIFVLFDVESRLTNLWRVLRGRGDTVNARQAYEAAANPTFLGARTQFILFTAGIRGAVSYALVQNIPLYDSVSGHGSTYKGELRAMTSATIVGVLFVFGALTYFGVDKSRAAPRLSVEDETSLSQLLMDDAQHLATSEEERQRAASFEMDHGPPQPQPGVQQVGEQQHRLA